jgi:hypothetical protein
MKNVAQLRHARHFEFAKPTASAIEARLSCPGVHVLILKNQKKNTKQIMYNRDM